ncbi:hypothetical protein BG006_004124 [Podila minutissima]|uniref:Fork-head domain-containing protein n=1 Tax=Podila minutissima TaxID=64525 RepID=A0A9P5SQM9_9FUNG|nr:hypothetical protein BG006_004124 [Podila minutissima]
MDSKRQRKSGLAKPNESWFLILVNAFKSNFEQTLTYKESELYNWIMQAYPYYRHDMHTMQTSVKTTLSSYECFRQNGRSTWTFIPRRALVHLESLKSEEGRGHSDHSGEDMDDFGEDDEDEKEEISHNPTSHIPHPHTYADAQTHTYPYQHQDHDEDVSSGSRIRFVDRHIGLMDADSPTLSAEEIQRFKQEHSAQAKKLKRKASGGHASRPRTRSPPASLQDECSMSMEAWCNLLVQMFEASPKQKTIREIYAWVHDNYPVYRNAPGDAWQADLTAALESNPLFRAMGRGRWQMATQPVQPVVIVNGSIPGSVSPHPGVKEEDEATDSPSVTEDEDWKAIGSKRLLNYSFRRYSIATDTFPKSHYKVGSTMSANSSLHPSSATAIATASGNSPLTATTSGGKLLPVDHRGMGYSTGRRFSSYHQPTPKNSPPLLATTSGLPNVDEFSLQLKNALSEETDDEDPGRRYMAPLQSAITTAVLALQSQSRTTPSNTSSSLPPQPPQDQAHVYPHGQASPSVKVGEGYIPQSHYYIDQAHPHSPHVKTESPAFSTQSSYMSSVPESTIAPVSLPEKAHPPGDSVRPEPAIVIPNGETLATDQMDAIQALALLCGGGV